MPSAKVLEQKQQIVNDLTEKLKTAVAGVLVDHRGLTVEEDTILRRELRAAGVEYTVVKNTLTRFAAKNVGYDELDPILNGPTALALSFSDVIAPAKILCGFAKKNENLEIKSGFMDGKVISIDEIKALADTPSKEVLIAKIMGSMNAPISKLVRTLQALVDNGVELADIKSEKAEEAPAEVAEEATPVAETAPAEVEAPAEEAAHAEETPAE